MRQAREGDVGSLWLTGKISISSRNQRCTNAYRFLPNGGENASNSAPFGRVGAHLAPVYFLEGPTSRGAIRSPP